jgi:hypothetical protein
MTEAEGLQLKDGTLAWYRDSRNAVVGIINYDKIDNIFIFNAALNIPFTCWTISDWKYYSFATKSEFCLYMLENA